VVDRPIDFRDWPAEDEASKTPTSDWPSVAREEPRRMRRRFDPSVGRARISGCRRFPAFPTCRSPVACPPPARDGALVLALFVWRVRTWCGLCGKTALVLQVRRAGSELRGLTFRDIQDHQRDRDGSRAGIEGKIIRRDPQAGRIAAAALFRSASPGAEIYAGNACWNRRC